MTRETVRLNVVLSEDEYKALLELAAKELRPAPDQLRFLLRKVLVRRSGGRREVRDATHA